VICQANDAGVEINKLQKHFCYKYCFAYWWFRLLALNHRGMKIMQIGETIYVTTRDNLRKWLIENHQTKKEIWLIRYKKATKKPSINYVEAVEEAICFGWIDNMEKGMDAERYATRFSPRKPKSNWTNTNKERARKMITEGRMSPAGKATLPPDVLS
jgi:uncharacterized protein YdeI (YjbR/CyaY-like superfamily)